MSKLMHVCEGRIRRDGNRYGLIAMAIIAGAGLIGDELDTKFNSIATSLKNAEGT